MSPLLVKPIKPKRLNEEGMRQALIDEMMSIANDIELDYQLTCATWEHQVKFEKLFDLGPNEIAILVATDDPIYSYVDLGTKEHIIAPKKEGGVLAFPSAFSPKSTPNTLASGAGSSGGTTVFAKFVIHPGTEPRNFTKQIREMWASKFRTRIQAAMRQVRLASDHAI